MCSLVRRMDVVRLRCWLVFLSLLLVLITHSALAQNARNYMGCQWSLGEDFQESEEPGAVQQFRYMVADEGLRIVSFYKGSISEKKYQDNEHFKVSHSSMSGDYLITSYVLKGPLAEEMPNHYEISVEYAEQSIVIVSRDLDEVRTILSQCITDSSLIEEHFKSARLSWSGS